MNQIRPRQLAEWMADDCRAKPLLLDVREPQELEICQIGGSRHMPMHLVPVEHANLPRDQDIVVICHHGGRSMQVAMFLEGRGFGAVHNLSGGVEAWANEVDPAMRRY